LQTKLHVFATQTATDPAGVAQPTPQKPQFVGSLFRFTQLVPHLVVPPPHASVHALVLQISPAGQMVPHAPQFVASFVVSTQLVPHVVVPPPHTS